MKDRSDDPLHCEWILYHGPISTYILITRNLFVKNLISTNLLQYVSENLHNMAYGEQFIKTLYSNVAILNSLLTAHLVMERASPVLIYKKKI